MGIRAATSDCYQPTWKLWLVDVSIRGIETGALIDNPNGVHRVGQWLGKPRGHAPHISVVARRGTITKTALAEHSPSRVVLLCRPEWWHQPGGASDALWRSAAHHQQPDV